MSKPSHLPVAVLTAASILIFIFFQYSAEQRFTLFFINKAIAETSIILIGLSYLIGPLCKIIPGLHKHILIRKYFGLIGFGGVVVHIVTSLLQYSGRINLEWYYDHLLGVIAAVIAIIIFVRLALTSTDKAYLALGKDKWKSIQRTGYIALILSLIHVSIASFSRWQMWWNNEVPMSLSLKAFVFISLILIIRVIAFLVDRSHPPKRK